VDWLFIQPAFGRNVGCVYELQPSKMSSHAKDLEPKPTWNIFLICGQGLSTSETWTLTVGRAPVMTVAALLWGVTSASRRTDSGRRVESERLRRRTINDVMSTVRLLDSKQHRPQPSYYLMPYIQSTTISVFLNSKIITVNNLYSIPKNTSNNNNVFDTVLILFMLSLYVSCAQQLCSV